MVIYMAAKVFNAVKPRAGTDEDTAGEPFWAVVAVGRTGEGSEVVVAVGACGFGTEVDVNLSLCFGGGRREAYYGDNSSESTIEFVHESSSGSSELWRSQCTSAE